MLESPDPAYFDPFLDHYQPERQQSVDINGNDNIRKFCSYDITPPNLHGYSEKSAISNKLEIAGLHKDLSKLEAKVKYKRRRAMPAFNTTSKIEPYVMNTGSISTLGPQQYQRLLPDKVTYGRWQLPESTAGKGPSPDLSMKPTPSTFNHYEVVDSKEDNSSELQEKKERNRLSAQKCRKRKKQYIESLESRIIELNKDIEKYKNEIKSLKESKKFSYPMKYTMYKSNSKELMVKLYNGLVNNMEASEMRKLITDINVFLFITY